MPTTKATTAQDTKVRLTCPRCANIYHLRVGRIPADAAAVRCKACGRLIDLRAARGTAGGRRPQGLEIPRPAAIRVRCRLDLMTAEKRRRPRW